MPELATLQTLFGAAMVDRERETHALPLISGDAEETRQRLAVYRRNIASNLAGALAAIYPIVCKLVAAEFFAGLAHAYSCAHPSASGDLNEFGAHLAEFLRTFAPSRALPYLPDVARLEWLVHKAHYARDHAPLDVNALADFPEDAYALLEVTLHPSVAVLSSAYPLLRIWQVHQDDYGGEIAVDLDSGGEQVVVYRPQFRATVAGLSAGEAAFLTAVSRGALLGHTLAESLDQDVGFDFAASLRAWIVENIVVDLCVNQRPAT
jgi:hypothetical protein